MKKVCPLCCNKKKYDCDNDSSSTVKYADSIKSTHFKFCKLYHAKAMRGEAEHG